MNGTVSIPELMDYLKQNELVIVHRSDYERVTGIADRKLEMMQEKALRKDALTLKEIIDLKLLPYTSKQGIRNLLKTGKLKSYELYTDPKSNKQKINTAAIKRIRETC